MYGTFVNTPNDIPSGEHWAIITGSSVFIPGDERSRTAPGHGYPEHTEHYIRYEAFTDQANFQTELQNRIGNSLYRNESIRGIHVLGTYEAKTTVALKEV